MGEPSEKAKACIERRRQKHLLDGPHPWVPSLLWEVPVPDVLPGPHGPPTPPMSLDTRGANPVTLFKNIDLLDNSNVSMYDLANVVEPTTVMVGNQVFYSANWVAAESTDGGDSFVYINPYSGPFADPHPQEDFCCDQTSAYDPSTNTVFWLQQYINVVNNTTGTQRINVDQDADGTWDCHYDITAQDMGWGTSRWLDFPDLVVSSNYLWHTSNVFTQTNVFDGSLAVRYPLSELATCAGTLNFDRYTHAGLFSFRLARGATTTGYFAAHAAQTAFMIFQWPDADAVPTQKVAPTAWWQWTGTRSCPGWDGRDWCGRHDSRNPEWLGCRWRRRFHVGAGPGRQLPLSLHQGGALQRGRHEPHRRHRHLE